MNKNVIRQLFAGLGQDEYIILAAQTKSEEFRSKGFNDVEKFLQNVEDLNKNATVANIWFTPNSFGSPDTHKTSNLAAINYLFVDIEDKTYSKIESNYGPFKPSIVVDSGHGLHLYWKLNESINPGNEDYNAAQNALIKKFEADSSKRNPASLLRVPGTANRKNLIAKQKEKGYTEETQCNTKEVNDVSYSLVDFIESDFLPKVEKTVSIPNKQVLQRKFSYPLNTDYPQEAVDEYGNIKPMEFFEDSAIKYIDIINENVLASSKKFMCPNPDCEAGHHSASSYLIDYGNGNFLIKDFKHLETKVWKFENEYACRNWWRIGGAYFQAVMLASKGQFIFSKRGAADVLANTGSEGSNFILRNKAVHDSISYNFIGGSGRRLSYELKDDEFFAYHELPHGTIEDNALINNLLDDRFGKYAQFMKEWIALYTYTNFLKLPMLIFKGDRGTGKNLIAEMIGSIYGELWGKFDSSTGFTEHNGLKLALLDEADEGDNVKLYSKLKDIAGSEKLSVNQKYGRKFTVKNNLNVIILSNHKVPLFTRSHEEPTDKYNNQWFVHKFPVLKTGRDNSLKVKLRERIGYWLRTDIKAIFDSLEGRSETERSNCRYQIPVPITDEEVLLFKNNKTETETVIGEFLENLRTPYILVPDLTALSDDKGLKLIELKNRLVELGVINSKESNEKRNLVNINGMTMQKARFLAVTDEFYQSQIVPKLKIAETSEYHTV